MVGPADVWAVGTTSDADPAQPWTQVQIVHWDGVRWSLAYSPPRNHQYNALSNVDFISPTDIIATGYGCCVGLETTYSINLHWDGTSWAESTGLAEVAALSAITPTDAWAIGPVEQLGESYPVVKHWDGRRWKDARLPDLGATSVQLVAVDAVSSDNVWVAGYRRDPSGSPGSALALHWDGTRWSEVDTVAARGGYLDGVSGFDAEDEWAIGGAIYPPHAAPIERWDGTRWSVVDNPADIQDSYLTDVLAISSTDAWIVGFRRIGYINHPWLLHWDGTSWTNYHRQPTSLPSQLSS